MTGEAAAGAHKARAMELATSGIGAAASGEWNAARDAWREALAYAERHLPDDEVVFWIRSGFGDALCRGGDHRGALAMAGSALEWCAGKRAPLAALTMATSSLRLGDLEGGLAYARQACALRGEAVLNALDPADRAILRRAAASPPEA